MKKIVIIGASSGLGYALAETFASRGVKVGLGARRTEPMHELQKKYEGMVVYRHIDVTEKDASKHLAELIHALGGMDIYIHVAGIGYENPLLDPEREAAIINTNMTGMVRMVSLAYDYFRNHGGEGQIAVVTSVAGTKGIGEISAYSASKAGASVYLQALRQLANKENPGISITDIKPGWVKTPLLKDGVKYPMEMSVEEVIPQILDAIKKRKRVAVIDARWGATVSLWKRIPDKVWETMSIALTKENN